MHAFEQCNSLEEISLGSYLTDIYQFNDIPKLKTATFDASINILQTPLFNDCPSLETVHFNADTFQNAYFSRAMLFSDCPNIKDLSFGDGPTNVPQSFMSGFTNLETIKLPGTIQTIDKGAFSQCSSLKTITNLNDLTLTSVGKQAFLNCFALTGSLTVTYDVEDETFRGCSNLAIEVTSSVKNIGKSAFESSGITKISFLNIESIPAKCFKNCAQLTTLEDLDKVTEISEESFYGCTGLTKIALPTQLTSVPTNAFRKCTGLTELTINDELLTIHSFAFAECNNLKTVNVNAESSKLKSVADYSFAACPCSIKFSENTYVSEQAFSSKIPTDQPAKDTDQSDDSPMLKDGAVIAIVVVIIVVVLAAGVVLLFFRKSDDGEGEDNEQRKELVSEEDEEQKDVAQV